MVAARPALEIDRLAMFVANLALQIKQFLIGFPVQIASFGGNKLGAIRKLFFSQRECGKPIQSPNLFMAFVQGPGPIAPEPFSPKFLLASFWQIFPCRISSGNNILGAPVCSLTRPPLFSASSQPCCLPARWKRGVQRAPLISLAKHFFWKTLAIALRNKPQPGHRFERRNVLEDQQGPRVTLTDRGLGSLRSLISY